MRTKATKAATILSAHKRRFGISPCPDNPIAARYPTCKIRRMATTKPKKPSKNQRPLTPSNEYLYGIRIPQTVEDAIRLDRENGKTLWQDAICKELGTIWGMKTFNLVAQPDRVGITKSHQYAPLWMIFTVKQDLCRKAWLVIGGHIVDAKDNELYASTMKGVSIRLLLLIATANKLDVLCGDIQLAYLYAKNTLKTYVSLGPEFNVFDSTIKPGTLATVEQALYGLPTSANRWHQHLAESSHRMGFAPNR
jgi:hypothetical protein